MTVTGTSDESPISAMRHAAPLAKVDSLSPSRAGDFLTCPLLYRFRTVDRLPERRSSAAVRGTLVHAVLERLFDLPAAQRTPAAARALLQPEWERLCAEDPELATMLADNAAGDDQPGDDQPGDDQPGDDQPESAFLRDWLASGQDLLDTYFTMEDPRRLEPAGREQLIEAELSSGLRLRGFIDRLDVAPAGEVRVVDYKTGRAPGEAFEGRALFQMKFYALVLWRTRGEIPRLLQLMYLGDGTVLRYAPEEADLRATERKVEALWSAISRALEHRDFRPRRNRLCDWCDYRDRCPEFGGTPPPWPSLH